MQADPVADPAAAPQREPTCRPVLWSAVWIAATLALLPFDAQIVSIGEALRGQLREHSATLNDALKYWTQAFGREQGFVLCALLLAFHGRRAGAWKRSLATLLMAVLATGAVVAGAKAVVGRARPGPAERSQGHYGTRIEGPRVGFADPQHRSFPSGHTAQAAAQSVVVGALVPSMAPVAWGLTATVALERVYDGKHYPSDVVAGAWVGWLVGAGVLGARRRGRLRLPWEPRRRA